MRNPSGIQVAVCAPSSMVSRVELQKGLQALEAWGFDLRVHQQTLRNQLFFAGSDQERADAAWELIVDPEVDVIWSARGGYGSARILALLEQRFKREGLKLDRPKLWVGYSDSTAVLEFVRTRLGFAVLHGEMPGTPKFFAQSPAERKALQSLVEGVRPARLPFEQVKLREYSPLKQEVSGTLVGGNLAVLVSLIGTPHAIDVRGKILFLEDIDESLYRLDRMVTQALSSGAWQGVKAVVLGQFTACQDRVPLVGGKPLRKTIPTAKGLQEVFGRIGQELGVPVLAGLPVGHGPKHCPLPLGAEYRLARTAQGVRFLLKEWEWLHESIRN